MLVDPQYGRPRPLTAADLGGQGGEVVLSRTPLHAALLEVPELPGIAPVRLESPLPPDMAAALAVLRAAVRG